MIRKLETTTWQEMKEFMRKTFFPPFYEKDVYDELQSLTQGSTSIDK